MKGDKESARFGTRVVLQVRVSPDTHALVSAAVDAANLSRQPGEQVMTMGVMVERCIQQALQPDGDE